MTYLEISKMRSYWKQEKQPSASIWKRKAKLSVWQKKNILQLTKCVQEATGKIFVKGIKVNTSTPQSISEETICTVLQ